MEDNRQLLRHFLATLAYRTQKALHDGPEHFGSFRAAPGVRTPQELLRHMTSVLGFARAQLVGGTYRAELLPTFQEEVARFHEMLADLSERIASAEFKDVRPETMLQGPLADAMTHVGQLAMIRRLVGSPVPPENFIVADITADNVGPDQPRPRSPDPEWYEAEDEPK
jgi:hypothetical protein